MKVGEYKGRKYRILYLGPTKYGHRAHLGFFDGSKDFWVDASLVTVLGSSYRRYPGYRQGDYCPCSGKPYCECGSDAPCCMCE
jgi:hypothetical protein